jgi:prephenate dehydrogenase
MWREILLDNREAVRAGLTAFRQALDDLDALVDAADAEALTAYLARVKALRERLA